MRVRSFAAILWTLEHTLEEIFNTLLGYGPYSFGISCSVILQPARALYTS